MYQATVINTLHKVPTGRYYINKKGEKRPILQRVVHRRIFLTAADSFLGIPRNLRIVRVARNGEVKYSLSGRKETLPTYWEKTLRGLGTTIAADYTKISSKITRNAPTSITYDELLAWLPGFVKVDVSALLNELDNGEPLEGDDIYPALAPYGYVKPEYEEEPQPAIAA